MGAHSRNARSGQNSGIGKRPTRARGLAKTSTSNGGVSSAPPTSSSLSSSSSRPGPAPKKLTSTTSVRRGSLATSKKPVSQRSLAEPKSRQAPTRVPEDEEIVAEIVVKTEDDSVDMDEDPSDILIESKSSVISDIDTPEPRELPFDAPSRPLSSQSPQVRQSQETTSSVDETAPPKIEKGDDFIDHTTLTRDSPALESLDDLSELASTPADPSNFDSQNFPSSPALLDRERSDVEPMIIEEASITGQEINTAKSDIEGHWAPAAKEMRDLQEITSEDGLSKTGDIASIDDTHSPKATEPSNDSLLREKSPSDSGAEMHVSTSDDEKAIAEPAHEASLCSQSHSDGQQNRPDPTATNETLPSPSAMPFNAGLSSHQIHDSSKDQATNDEPAPKDETTLSTDPSSVSAPQLATKSAPSDTGSAALTIMSQGVDSSTSSLTASLVQSVDLPLLPMKVDSTQHSFRDVKEASSGIGNPHETLSSQFSTSMSMHVKTMANGSPGFLSRADVDEGSEIELSEAASTGPTLEDATPSDPTPSKSAISHLIANSRQSFASSASALTERSGLSSKPPSVSSKATTPLDSGSPREPPGHFFGPTSQTRPTHRIQFNVRPRVSVPTDLTPQEYAIECIEAAENSRLNPYALHQEEYRMLRNHISHAQVTTYLNIRNGILRLWVRNPQIAVTREEAIGCAKDTRWFDVANVCFDWLVRRGFINYGCVEIRQQKNNSSNTQPRRQRTIVVIGAGFSGLGCARQLTGLSQQYAKRFREMGEDPPRVLVLEGRTRVGGRVYSRAFQTLPDTAPGIFRGKRFTAEMGGMIITGFDRGNPLNILVRGQLGLPYHCLRSDMSLYDTNGTAVDPVRDQLVEHLFNACLDRVSEYKFKTPPAKLIEGNHDLMDEGKDSSAEGHKTIALVEETAAAQPHARPVSEQNVAPQVNLVPVSTDRMTGKVHVEPGTPGSMRAAFKARSLGWNLKAGVSETKDIELDAAASDSRATLGSVVDEALMQHKEILDLNAQDFRLLNWHIANLEYSNATNLSKLSIKGWDIDAGNEWEGKHTMVVGGYQSVARGLLTLPAALDIQHKAAAKRINYAPEGSTGPVKIALENGQTIEADYVVNTIPLGVLKHGNVEFQPALPSWKSEAINRLGFGVLNKVILVYKEAFWDKERDIFGMLQTPTNRLSLNQKDYASRRGRFFQWFNVTNTTGMPCLLALMAGDAGYDTEVTPNDELIAEATEVLRMRYGARVTQPLEAIVTRWESDRFARGSYSNAGVNMTADDYNLMAKPLGNLYFAGEHTTVTHPATVHGAYLSGLRAASEVFDSILGPIDIPIPLVLPRETSASLKRKAQEEMREPTQARLEAYEMEIAEHIRSTLGPYPIRPAKIAGNPYLLFNKANYDAGRKRCEEGRRVGKGKPSPNEIRTMTSKMWKEAPPEVRKPFEDQTEEQKRVYAQALKDWTEASAAWEREAIALREKYVKEHPSLPTAEELAGNENASWAGGRRAKRVESYAEDDSDVDMV